MSSVKRSIFLQILSKSFASRDKTFVRMCVGVKEAKPIALQAKCVQNVLANVASRAKKKKKRCIARDKKLPNKKLDGDVC